MSIPSRPARRSDEIRRRRMLQSHLGKQSTAKHGAGNKGASGLLGQVAKRAEPRRRPAVAHTPPPVMARGFSTANARKLRSSQNGRRLHRVALGTQGAEMSLPSMPRIGFGWRAASFCLMAFLGAALYYMWTAPRFQVDAAEISGLKRITRGDVNRELALRNQPIFSLDETDLQTRLLKSFPEFSSAQVTIDLPNTVWITVTERIPVLVWHQGSRTILLDEQGMTFQSRDQISLAGLPVVEAAADPPPVPGGPTSLEKPATVDQIQAQIDARSVLQEFEPTQLLTKETLDGILKLDGYLPQGATLVYNPVHGFGWQDIRGWPVFFGDLSNLELKYAAYQAIVAQIGADGGKPELISVEFVRAPYFKLAKQDQGSEN